MEKRLWYFITWPSAILTLIFGPALLFFFQPILQKPWLLLKLFFVFLLFLYHLSCHKLYKELQNNQFKYTSTQLRVWNEVATLLLFTIVFLVVLKNLISVGQGLLALFVLGALMSLAIKIYKKNRNS